MRWKQPRIPVEISGVGDIRGDKIDIVLSANGSTMTVNRNHVDFAPGHVLLPKWLHDKILPYLSGRVARLNDAAGRVCASLN